MKVLILGGTKFLGRHLIEAALKNSHEVTLFNRGKFSQKAFENVEQIHGDRNFDLQKLAGRRFDVCIDTCGYLPQSVKVSAGFLRDLVNQYVFISSISAYKNFRQIDSDESASLAVLTAEQRKKLAKIDVRDDLTGVVLGEMYGALKVLCEREAEKAMPNRVLTVRPGLIVGKFDWTDRFSYWVMRVAKGGEVLAPASPQRFIQFIDARDLAKWIIKMAEENQNGIFNATGKPFKITFGKFLEEIKNVTQSSANFTWVSEGFLKEQNVEAWSEMPLYLHESEIDWQGFLSVNIDKALEKGFSFHDLNDTIRTTFNWRNSIKNELKAGISAERESELLEKWHERQ